MTTTTILTVRQLRALASVAGKDDTRPHITQVWFAESWVGATNGHRLVLVDLPTAERDFGIPREDILAWTSGLKRDHLLRIQRVGDRVSILYSRPGEARGTAAANRADPLLTMRASDANFPSIAGVVPACVKDGAWPAPDWRDVRAHALNARYLEDLGEFHAAFVDSEQVALELLSAETALMPIVYGSRFRFDGDDPHKEPRRRMLVIQMPMRAS